MESDPLPERPNTSWRKRFADSGWLTRMNSDPLRRRVVLANPNGLHLRPSATFAELAGKFQSKVTVSRPGCSADGKSIWDLIALAAEHGTELTLEADGPDAPEALDALAALLSTAPVDV